MRRTGAVRDGLADIISRRDGGSGLMRFFEDMPAGERREFGSFTFTADEIKRVRGIRPQRFHLSEEEGDNSRSAGSAAVGLAVARSACGCWCSIPSAAIAKPPHAARRSLSAGRRGLSRSALDQGRCWAGDTITSRARSNRPARRTRGLSGASCSSATSAPTSAGEPVFPISPPPCAAAEAPALTRQQGYFVRLPAPSHQSGERIIANAF